MKVQRAAAISLVIGLVFSSVAVFGLHAETGSPIYIVIEANEIADVDSFKESYIKLVPPAVVEAKFADGRVLALTQSITALDGPAPKFIAILAFPSVEKARAFHENMKDMMAPSQKNTKSRSFIIDNINTGVRPF
jgi:uncharacterized protein (DUF1330 family)